MKKVKEILGDFKDRHYNMFYALYFLVYLGIIACCVSVEYNYLMHNVSELLLPGLIGVLLLIFLCIPVEEK